MYDLETGKCMVRANGEIDNNWYYLNMSTGELRERDGSEIR